MTVLTTLTITHNRITDAEGLRGILDCPNVSVVDLSHNELNDPEAFKVFYEMENLKVLVLTGNPIIKTTSQYRKTMIVNCKKLTYLDDRPIFPKERACAEAFMEGGRDAERAARAAFNQREKDKQARGVQHLMDIQARARAARDAEERADRTDSEGEQTDDDVDTDASDNEGEDDKPGRHTMTIADQMNPNSQNNVDLSNWEPAPEQRVVEMDTITGPKAADIDLFDSEDEFEDLEFEDLDEDEFKNEVAAPAEPLMSVNSTTRTQPAQAKEGRTKMMIEEVDEDEVTKNASTVPAAVASGEVCRNACNSFHTCSDFCREYMASQVCAQAGGAADTDTESDTDSIPEEIVRPNSKKGWESINDKPTSPNRPHITTTTFVTELDDAVPDLEKVDLETGEVVSRITIQEDSARTAPPKGLIEMIGGDDMDGLD